MRPDSTSGGEVGIGAILSALWRRKLLILVCAFLGVGASLALITLLPPRYTASVSILLDPKGPGGAGEGEFASTPVDSIKVGSVVSVLLSTELLDSVVKAQHLLDDPEFRRQPGLVARIMRLLPNQGQPRSADTAGEASLAAVSEALRSATTVTRDGFTYVIKVDVSVRSPTKAKRLAQAIAETYISKQLDTKELATDRNLKWLTERLKQLSIEQMASEAEVETVRRAFGLAESDGGVLPVTTQQINDLVKEIVIADTDLSQKKSRADLVDKLQRSGADLQSLPEVSNSQVVTVLRQRLAEAVSKLAEQTQSYGTRHPAVIQADNDRQSIQSQLDAEVSRIATNVRTTYEAGLQRQQALQDQLTRLKEEEGRGSEGRSRLRQAQHLAQANRQLFDLTLARYKEVEQKQTLRETAEARIISPAVLPASPSFPKPLLFLLGGLCLGAGLGCGFAYLLENRDRTFSTPAQIEQLLGLPVIATIPMIRRADLQRGGSASGLVDYTSRNPLSMWAESLRSIRTGLADQPGKRARVIQFTSPMPNEGKSTISAAVAVSSAMAGQRTILIDCDFRNPSTTRTFDLGMRPGTADYLTGSASLADVIAPTATPLLSVIPAGTDAGSHPDAIHPDSIMRLVLAALEVADQVIIDSAAVEVVADAAMIAQAVDRTMMVVKWRSSDRAVVARAVDRIGRVSGRVSGIVMNQVDLDAVAQYGYVSRAHMRQIGRYYRIRHAPAVTAAPVQSLLRHSVAVTVTLASLTTILSIVALH